MQQLHGVKQGTKFQKKWAQTLSPRRRAGRSRGMRFQHPPLSPRSHSILINIPAPPRAALSKPPNIIALFTTGFYGGWKLMDLIPLP